MSIALAVAGGAGAASAWPIVAGGGPLSLAVAPAATGAWLMRAIGEGLPCRRGDTVTSPPRARARAAPSSPTAESSPASSRGL